MFIPIRQRGSLPVQTSRGQTREPPSLINGVQSCLAPQLFARSDSSLVVALLNSLIATAT